MHPCVYYSIVAETWEPPACPSVEDWTKQWCVYSLEPYSATRKGEIPPFAATWVDLESIVLSKISPMEKDRTSDFTHM